MTLPIKTASDEEYANGVSSFVVDTYLERRATTDLEITLCPQDSSLNVLSLMHLMTKMKEEQYAKPTTNH